LINVQSDYSFSDGLKIMGFLAIISLVMVSC